tara:strand:- start:1330 stop:1710 length:381 start_codon:yes stop_codon:yes gene_type:complete
MADRKITELAALSAPTGKDLLYVVDDPSGTPVSKKVSLHDMFGSVPANTSITGTATVSGNTSLSGAKTTLAAGQITLTASTSVGSNNATTVLGRADGQGTIFWDQNYLYVATSNTQVKRVALSVFS